MNIRKFLARCIMYRVNKNKDAMPFEEIRKMAAKEGFEEIDVQDVIKDFEREGLVSIELGDSIMVKPVKEREDFAKIK